MLGAKRLGRLVAVALLATLLGAGNQPAFAGDRIADLTTKLSSSSEKTRLQAVLSLARLGDKRAMKPLVTALQDPNPQIRAVAATALGKLNNKGALPALKTAAADDVDETVRRTARDAANTIAKAHKLENEIITAPASTSDAPAAVAAAPVQARKTGFGRSPHAVEDRPDLYVTVKSANDDSPGKTDKPTRKTHAAILSGALKDSLRKARQVTMTENDAQRWGLEPRQIDISVVKMDVQTVGHYVEVSVELRLAISNNKDEMLSFLSGGAKVQVPTSKFKPAQLANMRKEALEGAMSGLFDKLLTHLRQITTT
jgi:hypothetical protein